MPLHFIFKSDAGPFASVYLPLVIKTDESDIGNLIISLENGDTLIIKKDKCINIVEFFNALAKYSL